MKATTIFTTILGAVAGAAGGAIATGNIEGKKIEKWKNMSDKHLSLFLLMNDWMRIKQEGKQIKEYFDKNGYQSVAIYGMSYIGERLLDELRTAGIEVKYGIDRNADSVYVDLDVYSPDDTLMEVDVVVVTAICFYDEICNVLDGNVRCPIVSFEDILYEIG